MSAAKILLQTDSVIRCIGTDCAEAIEGISKPSARSRARAAGWRDFAMTERGALALPSKKAIAEGWTEVWMCPSCEEERAAAVSRYKQKRLVVFDGADAAKRAEQARKDESDLRQIEAQNVRVESSFAKAFRPILSGEQMAACEMLRAAFGKIATAGNATPSYDGISVDTFSFGSKTISDDVCRALAYERSCMIAVVSAVQMIHHDAWRAFKTAIDADLSATELGEWLNRSRKDRMGEKRRRAIAVDIVERSSSAVLSIRY